MHSGERRYVAFSGHRMVAGGPLLPFVLTCREFLASDPTQLQLFETTGGYAVDVDFRGDQDEVIARLREHPTLGEEARGPVVEEPLKRGRGRPKLGVVSREISLLPRHWEWLSEQPRSASASLRKLVDDARKADGSGSERRKASEAIHRVMWALAGDLPGFEDASRLFFRRDFNGFLLQIDGWPGDVRDYLAGEVRERLMAGG